MGGIYLSGTYDTGLYYFGARYYDSENGLFLTPDPAMQFLSPYLYTGGNPVNRIDPTGMCSMGSDPWDASRVECPPVDNQQNNITDINYETDYNMSTDDYAMSVDVTYALGSAFVDAVVNHFMSTELSSLID